MRRLVYALSLSTLFFAVCTAYLARELYLERASPEAAGTPAASTAAPGGKPVFAAVKSTPATAASTTATPSSSQSVESVNVVSQASPDASKMLARLKDPAQRAAMLEERKSIYRMSYPGLAEHLHLSDEDFERFIDLISRHELDLQETSVECYIEKGRSARCVDSTLRDAQEREVANLFGGQTMEAFDYFRHTQGERQTMTNLRARLPDKYRLLDTQSEALISALYEEQQRIGRDMSERGAKLTSFNSIIYAPIPGAPADDESEQAASNYNRMLRDRASTVLTPEQLAVYEKMQQEAMQSFRSMEVNMRRAGSSSQAN